MDSNLILEQLKDLGNLKLLMGKIYSGEKTNDIAEATYVLREYSKQLISLPQYVQILESEEDVGLKQLSAILIKKNINEHFKNMEQKDRQILRDKILAIFFNEKSALVQQSLCSLVGYMSKASFNLGDKWEELMVTISEKSGDKNSEDVRLQTFGLLASVLEISGENLSDYYQTLFEFFYNTIKDKSESIRRETMICILNMCYSFTNEMVMTAFGALFEPILEVLYEAIKDEAEVDLVQEALEMLYFLTEKKVNFFTMEQIEKLIQLFCLPEVFKINVIKFKGILSENLHPLIRESMLDILRNIILNYKQTYTKNIELQKKLIEITFTLACNKEKDEDPDKESIQDVALLDIRQIGIMFPKKKSYPIFKEYMDKMFTSTNNIHVEAAFLILGNLCEGCSEQIKRDLPDPIMKKYIANGLNHSDPEVKKATFITINHFAEFLNPDIYAFHEEILPALISNLRNYKDQVLEDTLKTIEIFCQEIEDPSKLTRYLPELIPKLYEIAQDKETTNIVKKHAFLAISACAEGAKENFATYGWELVPIIVQYLGIESLEYLEIRSVATHCLGVILGNGLKQGLKENATFFQQYIVPSIEQVYNGLKTYDNPTLKEYSFSFFYHLAYCLEADFEPYMETVVTLAFENIERAKAINTKSNQFLSLDTDSEDEGGEVIADRNVLDEISAIVHCLGEVALSCPNSFLPYYKPTVTILEEFESHYYEGIRIQSLVCYKNLAKALAKLEGKGTYPTYERGLPCVKRFSEDLENFLNQVVLYKLFYRIEADDHPALVRTALEIVSELVVVLGPASIQDRLENLSVCLYKVLSNQTEAQKAVFEDEEESDIQAELFGVATEVIEDMSKACKNGFMEIFENLFPLLQNFTKEDSYEDDVAQTIGTYAKCIKHMAFLPGRFGKEILDTCFKVIDYNDEFINSNVAYCFALFCEYGRFLVAESSKLIMEKLKLIYDNAMLQQTKDNAMAAIARMIYSIPQEIPTKFVLPAIIEAIPFKGDIKENRIVLKMMLYLFEMDLESLSGHEKKAIEFLVNCIENRASYKIKEDKVLHAIGSIMRKLSENPDAKSIIEVAASNLATENVKFLQDLIQGS